MTREEAIKELCDWLEQMIQNGVPSHSAKRKALAYAISALSAEQVTSKLKNPCDSLLTEDSEDSKEQKSKLDLISRADAVQCKPEFLNPTQNGESNEYNIGWNEAVKMYIHSLEEVPSVSAERVGEWIFNGYADEKKSWFICSECDHSQFHKSNYCHNCGARMVKESEE